ncbi:protein DETOXIFICATION 24-like isoform X2 [Camellia sinensis]|uniref:protein DETOXIFICATION 24-like isoform X2 n=1 Tax=Camellia sinensis TaxID=4442 RepID=UPI001036D8D2|nr:protein DETOXIFICATION 24-like isoform X2 [Camellia sinensis]
MDGNNKIEERLLTSTEGGDGGGGGGGGGDLKKRVWVESRKIWRVAFPGILARVSSFGTLVITQSFMGHISELDLAAYALVQTLIVRFSNGMLLGMSSATETLCGQAFGAGQHHMMGIYLQRSWIVDFVTITILLPLFIFTAPIFRLLGEEEAIAKVAKNIALWFIAFIYSLVFAVTIQMYLQAQLKNMIVACICTSTFAIHVLLSWIFVSILDLGIPGAMGALAISSWLVVLGEFVFVFGGWCPHSWKGFTTAAFSDLWPVVKLSVSSGIMLCLEIWYNSVLILVAGYMSNAEVAISAFSICLNISAWEFMLCLGFLGAACVRVANELGRGDARAAKFSVKVILCTSVLFGLIFFVLCLIFGHDIAYLFTSNEEVAATVSDLSVLLAFTMLLNSIQPVLTGVAIGAGLQSIVAGINLCCFYVIGIPIGVLLAYVADLEVKGIWIGMTTGVVMQVIALAFMVWRTDWDEQVNKASERLGRWFLKPSEESDEVLNHS